MTIMINEVAGFVFWPGHKNQNAAHASRYDQNLVHHIKTLRKDFHAPEAKFERSVNRLTQER